MTQREAILAWRIWRLRSDPDRGLVEPLLESCVYGDVWAPCEPFAAECADHPGPTPACGCGIYAVTTRETALEWARWAQSALPHPIVVGRVLLPRGDERGPAEAQAVLACLAGLRGA